MTFIIPNKCNGFRHRFRHFESKNPLLIATKLKIKIFRETLLMSVGIECALFFRSQWYNFQLHPISGCQEKNYFMNVNVGKCLNLWGVLSNLYLEILRYLGYRLSDWTGNQMHLIAKKCRKLQALTRFISWAKVCVCYCCVDPCRQ